MSTALHRSRAVTVRGVSIVELMIALGVGAIVVLGLTQMLSSTNATYAREEQFARLQENGRIAAMLLAKQMRPNRSLECMGAPLGADNAFQVKACDLFRSGCAGEHLLVAASAMGYDGSVDLTQPGNLADLPSGAAANIAARWVRGDVLVTWGIEPDGVAMQGAPDENDMIQLSGLPEGLGEGDLALVSDCGQTYVFAVSDAGDAGSGTGAEVGQEAQDADGNLINATDDLQYLYVDGIKQYSGKMGAFNAEAQDPRAMLYPLVYKAFYICCTGTQDGLLQSGGGAARCRPEHASYDPDGYRPALCVFDLNDGGGRSQVLVPDVADMRVTYTGDSNSTGSTSGSIDFRADDTSTLRTAKWVSDNNAWPGVRSAAVELLFTTESGHTTSGAAAPARADWPPNSGGTIHADTLGAGYTADHRLYQRVRFDVAIRSGTPW